MLLSPSPILQVGNCEAQSTILRRFLKDPVQTAYEGGNQEEKAPLDWTPPFSLPHSCSPVSGSAFGGTSVNIDTD